MEGKTEEIHMYNLRRKLIGNRAFYAMVMAVVVPIIIQNAITNFVSLLDNLMVGSIGTDEMSGVAISNQLMFVFNLAMFGAVSGAGIFTAQYHGAGNVEGIRASMRYKLYVGTALTVIAIALFSIVGKNLISLYLTDTSDPERVARTLKFGMQYLRIMLLGMLPFAAVQCYAGTLREIGETRVPMIAGVIAVLVNLVFNYLLIFGNFGFPRLGVRGAAYATILSRYVEAIIVISYTHTHKKRFPFAQGLYSTLRIPAQVVKEITIKGMPLLVNEFLWSFGQATLSQIYSMSGLDVVAAMNITSTITNVFSVVYLSMGSAAAIIVGQDLGANEIETAKDHTWKLQAFSVAISLMMAVVLASLSPLIPRLYNTTEAVYALASAFLLVFSINMPAMSFCNCGYFVMRSGGKTGLTFAFDSGCSWLLCVPVAYVTSQVLGLPVVAVYACVQVVEIIKACAAMILLRKGVWINNIVSGEYMQMN